VVALNHIKVAFDEKIDREIETWREEDSYGRSEQIGRIIGGFTIELIGAKGFGTAVKQLRLLKKVTIEGNGISKES